MITKKWLPKRGHYVHFVHRDVMNRKRCAFNRAHRPLHVPAVSLPVDSTGNATVTCPMNGNDQYGDCGEAMIAHADDIRQWANGKGVVGTFTDQALIKQYLALSGGDNGMDEDMVVGPQGAWTTGIAGNPKAIAVDHLDFDPNDNALTQYLIDNFYTVELAWSVPDAFINGFATGTKWDVPAQPDPNNGHYTPLADVATAALAGVASNGWYRLWTWGTWCWVSPAFVQAVQPSLFATFSPRQFSTTTGLDGKGRHITTQATVWQSVGGNPISSSVLAAFPPLSPTPAPGPAPTPLPSSNTYAVSLGTGGQWNIAATASGEPAIAPGQYAMTPVAPPPAPQPIPDPTPPAGMVTVPAADFNAAMAAMTQLQKDALGRH